MEQEYLHNQFKEMLFNLIKRNPRFRYLLEESLRSGYLSVDYLNALTVLNLNKVTISVPKEILLSSESVDFKAALLYHSNKVPPEKLIQWIKDVLQEEKNKDLRQ